jgi:hypothetical protein
MEFTHSHWLEPEKPYKIKLTITTVNGYTTSVIYPIARMGTFPIPMQNLFLEATQTSSDSKENGYINIQLKDLKDEKGRSLA